MRCGTRQREFTRDSGVYHQGDDDRNNCWWQSAILTQIHDILLFSMVQDTSSLVHDLRNSIREEINDGTSNTKD